MWTVGTDVQIVRSNSSTVNMYVYHPAAGWYLIPGGGINYVSCDIPGMCVPPLACLCFFPLVFLSSRVTGACPVTTDLIMRVNVRTTTTTAWSQFAGRWKLDSLPSSQLIRVQPHRIHKRYHCTFDVVCTVVYVLQHPTPHLNSPRQHESLLITIPQQYARNLQSVVCTAVVCVLYRKTNTKPLFASTQHKSLKDMETKMFQLAESAKRVDSQRRELMRHKEQLAVRVQLIEAELARQADQSVELRKQVRYTSARAGEPACWWR